MISGRRLLLGMLMLTAGLVGLGLTSVLLYILSQPAWRLRIDMTQTGQAGLSTRTGESLAGLPEGSRVTAFLIEEDGELVINGSAVYPRAFERLRSLLEDARIRSRGKLEVQVLEAGDLVRLSAESKRLSRQPGELLIFESENRRQVYPLRELFEIQPPTDEGLPARLKRERVDDVLHEAATRLALSDLPRVGIRLGSGIRSAQDDAAFGAMQQLLRSEGFEPVPVELLGGEESFDLLWVPGVPDALHPTEQEFLQQWLKERGPLMLGLGGRVSDSELLFWNELLQPAGVEFGDGLVCEPLRQGAVVFQGSDRNTVLYLPRERLDGLHPTTRRIAEGGRFLRLAGARPLQIVAGTNDYLRDVIARSGPNSWIDLPEGALGHDFSRNSREPQGAQSLIVAVKPLIEATDGPSGRMILCGSGSSMRYDLAVLRDWLVASFRWLQNERVERRELTPLETLPFHPGAAARARLNNLAILALPGATLLLALLIYLRRRR